MVLRHSLFTPVKTSNLVWIPRGKSTFKLWIIVTSVDKISLMSWLKRQIRFGNASKGRPTADAKSTGPLCLSAMSHGGGVKPDHDQENKTDDPSPLTPEQHGLGDGPTANPRTNRKSARRIEGDDLWYAQNRTEAAFPMRTEAQTMSALEASESANELHSVWACINCFSFYLPYWWNNNALFFQNRSRGQERTVKWGS